MISVSADFACHMDTACAGVGQGVGNTAAVTDDIQALIQGFQIFIDLHFHVVELDFHTIEQRIFVGSTGCHLVQGIDHLNDAVQNTLGQHKAQIAGGGVESGSDEGGLHALFGGAAAPDKVAEALDDNAAAQLLVPVENVLGKSPHDRLHIYNLLRFHPEHNPQYNPLIKMDICVVKFL